VVRGSRTGAVVRKQNAGRDLKTPARLLPDAPTLTTRLTAALNGGRSATHPVTILKRELPPFMSTFPNEIVTCRLADGRRRRVFVKYQAGHSHDSYGHRGDIPYETEVYRRLLDPLRDFRPKCLGAHTDPDTGDVSLFLEYVYRNVRLCDMVWKRSTRQPRAMIQAAQWVGHFHAAHERCVDDRSLAFLKRYDDAYYRGWAQRTLEFAAPLHARFPWLTDVCERDEWFAPLLDDPPTVIHGEFYAKNVLVRRQHVFMVDWESTAVAAGAVDLAALTEGKYWPAALVRRCERAYVLARWPDGAPPRFARTLDAARVYLHFRWLGERPDWTIREKNLPRYDQLYAAAKRLSLI
jgi:hypothetical protein